MATYDNAYLLDMFNRYAGRAQTDGLTDAVKYKYLSDAQNRVVAEIAARAPSVLVGSPTAMTSADGGYTFTFGTDTNGFALFPLGKVAIYPSLASVPDDPWSEGVDYLNEGTKIRIPNNGTYAGSLYWRGITPPADITAAVQPTLLPEQARELIVIEAVRAFGQAGNLNPDLATQMLQMWAQAFPRWLLVFRTQFRSGGALAPLTAPQGDDVGFAAYPGI